MSPAADGKLAINSNISSFSFAKDASLTILAITMLIEKERYRDGIGL
jgi:hypothetical protein